MLKKTLATMACSLLTVAAYAGTAPVAPAPVQQEPYNPALISYNNFSLGYQYSSTEFLGGDIDGHGIAAGLEFSPVDHLYLALNGSWTNMDVFGIDFDYWTAQGGIGGYIPLNENIHLVGEVGASYANLGLGDFDLSTDDWGFYATPHLRMKYGAFETHVGITYNSNDLVISEWSAFARLMYEVNPSLDIYVGVSHGFETNDAFDDVFGAQAGLRFKF